MYNFSLIKLARACFKNTVKKKRSKINHLNFYLTKLDKEEQIRMNLVPILQKEVSQKG